MRLLIDMNLSPAWVAYLHASGHKAVHWSMIGPATAADVDVMQYARTQDAVVLTHDLDFGAILAATGGRKPSVVQIRADQLSPAVIGTHIVAALEQLGSELAQGALLTVEPGRTRVSLLPLQTDR